MFRKATFRKTTVGLCLIFFLASVGALAGSQRGPNPAPALVDINSASLEDIEAVGLNRDLARAIIDNRPYANKRQLVTRRLLSMEEYDRIQDRIVARQPRDPE